MRIRERQASRQRAIVRMQREAAQDEAELERVATRIAGLTHLRNEVFPSLSSLISFSQAPNFVDSMKDFVRYPPGSDFSLSDRAEDDQSEQVQGTYNSINQLIDVLAEVTGIPAERRQSAELLQSSLATSRLELSRLTAIAAQRQANIETLQSSLATSRSELTRVTDIAARRRESIETLQSSLATSRSELATSQRELRHKHQKSRAEVKILHDEMDGLSGAMRSL
jgi:DNA repair exonuclease SbcCD ATPase subunit